MSGLHGIPSSQWPDFLTSTDLGGWAADPLGEDFEHTTLDLGADGEGPVLGTLVRYVPKQPPPGNPEERGILLSVHGWSDYFYNRELAEFWRAAGYRFYALDLRRYGRSLRSEHQRPGYVEHLAEYHQELDAAADLLTAEHPGLPLLVQGHSLGGLIISLWAQQSTARLAGLVLNAPWLEFQGTQFLRIPAQGLMEAMARRSPTRILHLPELDHYWLSLSQDGHGEWDIHPLWRPRHAFRPTVGWMRTVLEAHAKVAKGLDLELPVLVLTSAQSHFGASYDPLMQRTDSVVDVNLVRQRSLKLGSFVTNAIITDAMHDVFTSSAGPRAESYAKVRRWLHLLQGAS